MKSTAKRMIRDIIRKMGFDLKRYDPQQVGVSAIADIRRFLRGANEPLILDVGANVGQSTMRFLNHFKKLRIHSFEPSPSTFERLEVNCSPYSQVTCWNCGVGSKDGLVEFHENEMSDMSSFLTPSRFAWGNIVKSSTVNVVSLDTFASEHDIKFIHLLKSDTQGYDLEVLKGAKGLMDENRIGLVYFEFIFSHMYANLPAFDDVFRYLTDKGFLLVSFYDLHFQKELMSWADAMFINCDYYGKLEHC